MSTSTDNCTVLRARQLVREMRATSGPGICNGDPAVVPESSTGIDFMTLLDDVDVDPARERGPDPKPDVDLHEIATEMDLDDGGESA